MATLPTDALESAEADGLLTQPKGLSDRQRVYLQKGVVTAADAYYIISQAKESGLDYDQFSDRMAIARNTAIQYANWLQKQKLITISKSYSGGKNFNSVEKVILRAVKI